MKIYLKIASDGTSENEQLSLKKITSISSSVERSEQMIKKNSLVF